MFEQHLPTYIRAFENDARWITRTSDHYVFHYFSNSEAEKDMGMIIRTQEAAYESILSTLKVPVSDRKIEYFFYPDPSTKIALMGDDWYAQAIYNEFRVHVLYTANDKPIGPHEDTHLLSLPWGLSVGFFQEGLAEYMVGHAWDGTPHAEYVRQGYEKKMFCPISDLMNHQAWMDKCKDSEALHWYSLAGAFVAFLIDSYGMEKFERFYKQSDRKMTVQQNESVFRDAYGFSSQEAEVKFKSSLKV